MSRTLAKVDYSEEEIRQAEIAKALGHPLRIKIIKLLSIQSCCCTGDLTAVFPLAQSTISQHLKVLKDAGLIQGNIEPPSVKYCLHEKNWPAAKQSFRQLFED